MGLGWLVQEDGIKVGISLIGFNWGFFFDNRCILVLLRLNDGSLQSKLKLGFCGSIELFVNGRVITIESNIRSSRVREAVESNFAICRNL